MSLRWILPDYYQLNILEIEPEHLKKIGIRGIICDLDNTIIPWDQEVLQEEMIDWFLRLKRAGFQICLLSNSLHGRVSKVAESLDIEAIPAAIKPRKGGFKRAVHKLGLSRNEIVVIGDQIFTDVLGGKRMGLLTILVKPMAEKELLWTKFIRRLERHVLRQMTKKGILTGMTENDELNQ